MNHELTWRARRPATLLLVSGDREEQDALYRILRPSHWRILAVPRIGDAVRLLPQCGVVVAPFRSPGRHSWRDLLKVCRRHAPRPRLIVTDPYGDEAMWAEVLNLGAHDMLVQPYEPRAVLQVLDGAWQTWQDEAIHWRAGAA